jgi:hypothetical protein
MMAVVQLTDEQRVLVMKAADAAWISPEIWLLEAIRLKTASDVAKREKRRAEMRPAPWEGWVFHPEDARFYYGPFDAVLFCDEHRWMNKPETNHYPIPDDDAIRPWEARIRHWPIIGPGGRARTFKTPEAAIFALYASPEFNKSRAAES